MSHSILDNQYLTMDYINSFLHSKIGLVKYREGLGIRKDAFFEYLPQENLRDNEVVMRLCNTAII